MGFARKVKRTQTKLTDKARYKAQQQERRRRAAEKALAEQFRAPTNAAPPVPLPPPARFGDTVGTFRK